MNEGAAASSLASDAPDWSTISRDILCPLCGYNLRGLIEPRCPECGYRGTWEVLLAEPEVHPYLFEHHSRRNGWSFARTIDGTMIPGEFWRSLGPNHPVRAGRLLLYWLLLAAPVLLVGLAIAAFFGFWELQPVLTVAMAWPWLTFGSLLIYRSTMLQVQIRWQHVLRCVIYCGDAGLLLAIPLGAVVALVEPQVRMLMWSVSPRLYVMHAFFSTTIWLGALPLIVLMGYRLNIAYRTYLNFPHATRAVLASQIITFLASMTICVIFKVVH